VPREEVADLIGAERKEAARLEFFERMRSAARPAPKAHAPSAR
jgi:hypothetical protein